MSFVVVESPFATRTIEMPDGSTFEAHQTENVEYARACLHDCLTKHGEYPYASHLLYTQPGVLDDDIPEERNLGISAGLEIGRKASLRIFYVDRGVSSGMRWAYRFAKEIEQPIEIRQLRGSWDIGWADGRTEEEILALLRE